MTMATAITTRSSTKVNDSDATEDNDHQTVSTTTVGHRWTNPNDVSGDTRTIHMKTGTTSNTDATKKPCKSFHNFSHIPLLNYSIDVFFFSIFICQFLHHFSSCDYFNTVNVNNENNNNNNSTFLHSIESLQ